MLIAGQSYQADDPNFINYGSANRRQLFGDYGYGTGLLATAHNPNGSNPVAPTVAPIGTPSYSNSSIPNYGGTSILQTLPGFRNPIPGTSTSTAAPAIPPTSLASNNIGPIPNYGTPVTDPNIDALNQKSFANISSEFSGQLPGDVAAQIGQAGAERGLSVGVGSPNANAATLRALGLTSLDLTKTAQQQFEPIQLAHISQDGDNFRAILNAKNAIDQLRISQAGETSRFNAGQQNDLQKQILSGQQAIQQLQQKGNQDIAIALLNATADQQRTILQGAQAMQQLQLSESGQSARLDAQLKAQLQSQVLQGQQALDQINAKGQFDLANTGLQNQGALDQIIARYQYPSEVPQQKTTRA